MKSLIIVCVTFVSFVCSQNLNTNNWRISFEKGQRNGVAKAYNQNGKLVETTYYKNGEVIPKKKKKK